MSLETVFSFKLTAGPFQLNSFYNFGNSKASNYATKEELDYATGLDTSYLAAKRDFIALKDEVNKLDINKLTNAQSSLSNKNNLDVGKLKTKLFL